MAPRNPFAAWHGSILFTLETPPFSPTNRPGGVISPGFDPTLPNVAFVSFEYVDKRGDFPYVSMVFEDPFSELCDHQLIVPAKTELKFRFGYLDDDPDIGPWRRMVLTRIQQNYPADGHVQTELSFYARGNLTMGFVRRSETYRHPDPSKRGKVELYPDDLARIIADRHQLELVLTPCNPLTSSHHYEWHQMRMTDLEFLNDIGKGARPMPGNPAKRQRYFAWVQDNALYFGPNDNPKIEDQLKSDSYTYAEAGSSLIEFRPSVPVDLYRGLAMMSASDGLDKTGQRQRVEQAGDPRVQIDYVNNEHPFILKDNTTSAQTIGKPDSSTVSPSLAHRNISDDVPDLSSQLRVQVIAAYSHAVDTAKNFLLQLGYSKSEVTQATQQDNDLLLRIEANPALAKQVLSPDAVYTTNRVQDNMETVLQNTMTATARWFGQPRLFAGNSVTILGVSKKYFAGTWWMFEVRHKINRSDGFITTAEMQRYPFEDLIPAGANTQGGPVSRLIMLRVGTGYNGQYALIPTITPHFNDLINYAPKNVGPRSRAAAVDAADALQNKDMNYYLTAPQRVLQSKYDALGIPLKPE